MQEGALPPVAPLFGYDYNTFVSQQVQSSSEVSVGWLAGLSVINSWQGGKIYTSMLLSEVSYKTSLCITELKRWREKVILTFNFLLLIK